MDPLKLCLIPGFIVRFPRFIAFHLANVGTRSPLQFRESLAVGQLAKTAWIPAGHSLRTKARDALCLLPSYTLFAIGWNHERDQHHLRFDVTT